MRGAWALVAVAVLVAHVRAVASEEPAAKPAAVRTVWDGYVWKDKEGRLRIGWGVVAMGVVAGQAHVVAGPAAERLAKHAIDVGDYVFWNYLLERPDAEATKGLPRLLVRVEGVVEETGGDPSGTRHFPSGGTLVLKDARVVAVEFVQEAWLKAWATWFRERASPWRIRDDADRSEAGEKAFAPKGLAALQAMRAVPGPSEAQRAEARALGAKDQPEVLVAERFRRSTETDLQRWLVDRAREKRWSLPGLETLPPLPPSDTEVQGWFLGSVTKKELLERVEKAWKGDLGEITLGFYVATKDGVTFTSVDLEQVRARWTEEEFARHRKATQEVLGGR